MKTFSKAANQCHFVPCPRSERCALYQRLSRWDRKSFVGLEIGDDDLLKSCQPVPLCAIHGERLMNAMPEGRPRGPKTELAPAIAGGTSVTAWARDRDGTGTLLLGFFAYPPEKVYSRALPGRGYRCGGRPAEVTIHARLGEAVIGHGVAIAVRCEKARIFSRCKSCPDNWSLHPVAIGAAAEVTKPSKPSRQRAALAVRRAGRPQRQ
jgi:hypothetical protein